MTLDEGALENTPLSDHLELSFLRGRIFEARCLQNVVSTFPMVESPEYRRACADIKQQIRQEVEALTRGLSRRIP